MDHLNDIGLDITTRTLYEGTDSSSTRNHGLTDGQKEALLTAQRMGYFSFPQDSTLEEVGEALGVSRTAVSGRLHRGIDRLVENTIARDVRSER